MSCPSWCKDGGTEHTGCYGEAVYPGAERLGSPFALLLLLNEWDGNRYAPTPHVAIYGSADGARVSVPAGDESERLAALLEALGHADLAKVIRQLNKKAAEQ